MGNFFRPWAVLNTFSGLRAKLSFKLHLDFTWNIIRLCWKITPRARQNVLLCTVQQKAAYIYGPKSYTYNVGKIDPPTSCAQQRVIIFVCFFVNLSGMGWSPQASSIIVEFAIFNWTLVARPRFILRARNTKKDCHTSSYASNQLVSHLLSFLITWSTVKWFDFWFVDHTNEMMFPFYKGFGVQPVAELNNLGLRVDKFNF